MGVGKRKKEKERKKTWKSDQVEGGTWRRKKGKTKGGKKKKYQQNFVSGWKNISR